MTDTRLADFEEDTAHASLVLTSVSDVRQMVQANATFAYRLPQTQDPCNATVLSASVRDDKKAYFPIDFLTRLRSGRAGQTRVGERGAPTCPA